MSFAAMALRCARPLPWKQNRSLCTVDSGMTADPGRKPAREVGPQTARLFAHQTCVRLLSPVRSFFIYTGSVHLGQGGARYWVSHEQKRKTITTNLVSTGLPTACQPHLISLPLTRERQRVALCFYGFNVDFISCKQAKCL